MGEDRDFRIDTQGRRRPASRPPGHSASVDGVRGADRPAGGEAEVADDDVGAASAMAAASSSLNT